MEAKSVPVVTVIVNRANVWRGREGLINKRVVLINVINRLEITNDI